MDEKLNLVASIRKLENESKSLDVVPAERSELMKEVSTYADAFLNTLPQQKAYYIDGYEKEKNDDVFEIDGNKSNIEELLRFIHQRVDQVGLNPGSGGHFGYIPAGGLYTSALGDYIAAITNRYAGVFYASPGAVRIENSLINWVGKLIGYKKNFGGNITSGGSLANLISIAAARTAFKLKGSDLSSNVIYITQQAHHSILKALKLTGLDECVTRIIDLDNNYRMDLESLKENLDKDVKSGLKPFILFANAGSTDVGAIDPLEELGAIAAQYHLWYHVDAAYGGFFLLTPEGKEKLKGIELADSTILDPHKGLFIPYGSGMVMVKNVRHLYDANNFDANYMQDAVGNDYEFSPSQLSPELSKHFRGLRMWLPLKLHGLRPFAASLEEKILLTQYFYENVKQLGFHTGPAPDLSIIIFWFKPKDGNVSEYNRNLLKSIHRDGRIFISSTMINEQFMLRFAVLSFRTHLEQVDILLKELGDYIRRN